MDHTFLQIGLGSMGKRRIRNLLANGIQKERIFGFDIVGERRKEAEDAHGIRTYGDFKEALDSAEPDAYIISTTPDNHHLYFLDAARKKKHFFVETTTHDTGYRELLKLLDDSFVAAPSCTFRFFPAVKRLKQEIRAGTIGRILSFHYHMGQYLPNWHPWEDYTKVYFAQKETGGCREMLPFELNWLTDIVQSEVREICGLTKKISDLSMSADDIYTAVLQCGNNIVGNITIDLISRAPVRTLRLIGTEGVLDWEWLKYEIRIFTVKNNSWDTISIPKGEAEKGYQATEDMYNEEIRVFLESIDGKRAYPHTFEKNHNLLKALYALEKSSATGRIVKNIV